MSTSDVTHQIKLYEEANQAVVQIIKTKFSRNKHSASNMILNFLEYFKQESKRIQKEIPSDVTVRLMIFAIAASYCFQRSMKIDYINRWVVSNESTEVSPELIMSIVASLTHDVYRLETTKLMGDDCMQSLMLLLTWWRDKYDIDMNFIFSEITLDKVQRILKT